MASPSAADVTYTRLRRRQAAGAAQYRRFAPFRL